MSTANKLHNQPSLASEINQQLLAFVTMCANDRYGCISPSLQREACNLLDTLKITAPPTLIGTGDVAKASRVQFCFDDRSMMTVNDLIAQGFTVHVIETVDPQGQTQTLFCPCLATAPKDGEVTEEWFAANGFTFAWHRWRIGTINLEVVAWKYNDQWYFGICGEDGITITVPNIKTTAAVLSLLSALGIAKEQAQ